MEYKKRGLITIFLLLVALSSVDAQVQRGRATFYSKRATGARSASGERIHHDSLTCAHRVYPFGTLLRVRNPANDKEVVVRVTDRGPFARGRIIDLSWSAAKQLGILGHGVAMVEVEPVGMAKVPDQVVQRIELPEMDFEVTEAGYSFIDQWKKGKSEEPANGKEEASAPMSQQHRKSQKAAPHQSPTKKTTKHPGKNEPAENGFSRRFSRVKSWSEGLFN